MQPFESIPSSAGAALRRQLLGWRARIRAVSAALALSAAIGACSADVQDADIHVAYARAYCSAMDTCNTRFTPADGDCVSYVRDNAAVGNPSDPRACLDAVGSLDCAEVVDPSHCSVSGVKTAVAPPCVVIPECQ